MTEAEKQILLEWTKAMSVEVGVIDEEHRKLIAYMNDLYDGLSKEEGKEALKTALDRMVNYTEAHFKHEEDLFDQTNYPLAAEHKAIHKGFREKIFEFKERYENGDVNVLTLDLMRLLKSWIIAHIQCEDRKYTDHFHKNGIF